MTLSKQEIGTIIIRVFGIYALMLAGNYISIFIPTSSDGWRESGLFFMSAILPNLVIGIGFMLSAKTLGPKLVRSSEQQSDSTTISMKEWEELALSVVGYYLFFSGIPRIINVINLIAMTDTHERPAPVQPVTMQIVIVVVMIGVSLWLILGARGIVTLVRKLRTVGTP